MEGVEEVTNAVIRKEVTMIVIALDMIDKHAKKAMMAVATEYNVPVMEFCSKEQLAIWTENC